ncbi:MAG: helix-turn-helix domain-containing protein [Methylacidiphilales bacterium]|nr:helix-turn-helix domain-containing protein [Candidatus Methylacidiphilales bacterium]NJR15989.1 helix-turn-helix domain-containing protein [Calothrix sp. CSU_2_0]
MNIINNSAGKYLTPFQRKFLQKKQQENLSSSYRQRIEIMLLADEGKTQVEICRIVGCCPATARHWMHIARAGMAHQWQDCPLGRPKAIDGKYLERLRELLAMSPRDCGYGFKRWTVGWLGKHLAKELGIEVSDRHLKRVLKQMGLSTISKANISGELGIIENMEKSSEAKIYISDLQVENLIIYPDLTALEMEK